MTTKYLDQYSPLPLRVSSDGRMRGYPVEVRMLAKLKLAPNGCWEWTAFRDLGGYGMVQLNGRAVRSHRVSWAMHNGEIPQGMCVLHKCDNPPCCNPFHLYLGTNADNNADKVARNRQAKGDNVGMRLHPESKLWGDRNPARLHPNRLTRGEKLHTAVLTETDVVNARISYAEGVTRRELSRQYGVSYSTIDCVVNRRTWRHVP